MIPRRVAYCGTIVEEFFGFIEVCIQTTVFSLCSGVIASANLLVLAADHSCAISQLHWCWDIAHGVGSTLGRMLTQRSAQWCIGLDCPEFRGSIPAPLMLSEALV